jgi:flagellar protein FliS
MSVSIDAYRSINVGTANPKQIIMKLCAAAVRYLTEAEEALAQGQPHEEALKNARMIVTALMQSLNFQAGEIAQNLLRLYLFVLERIQIARVAKKGDELAKAREVMEILKTGWEEMPAVDARQGATSSAHTARVNLQG